MIKITAIEIELGLRDLRGRGWESERSLVIHLGLINSFLPVVWLSLRKAS